MDSFSVAKGGKKKKKHRVFLLPVGWMMRAFLPLMTVLMASSCQFLNVVKPKFFTSNPSMCAVFSSMNKNVKVKVCYHHSPLLPVPTLFPLTPAVLRKYVQLHIWEYRCTIDIIFICM